MDKIKKKIKNIFYYIFSFFKTYLPHIVFLVFAFQLLSFINTLPYFNLIANYYYYIFGILWVFSLFLFKKYISNKLILIVGILMFVLAIPATLIELDFLTNILGFVAFLLIATYVIRQVFSERILLRDTE